jgi:hypothetical protein
MLSSGSYSLANYPWSKAQLLIARRAAPAWVRYSLWAVGIGGISWLSLCLIVPQVGMVFGRKTPLVIIGVGIPTFLLLCRVWNANVLRGLNASVFRAGSWQAKIRDDGLDISSDGLHQVLMWSHLDAVIAGPDGLLVMSGTACGLPIPTTAFSSNAGYLAFRAELEARIRAAKEAA